jgi:hypothetical protein
MSNGSADDTIGTLHTPKVNGRDDLLNSRCRVIDIKRSRNSDSCRQKEKYAKESFHLKIKTLLK